MKISNHLRVESETIKGKGNEKKSKTQNQECDPHEISGSWMYPFPLPGNITKGSHFLLWGYGMKDEMIGRVFTRWTVVEYVGKDRRYRKLYKCKCDCGTIKTKVGTYLRYGSTKSCGCYNRDIAKKTMTKHGLYKHPLYRIWTSIKARCKNKKRKAYKHYGGRGIAICNEWDNNFISFYNFAIDSGWETGLEIDRIDTNGDYTPKNCRFVDRHTQMQNCRHSMRYIINGEKYQSASQAAKKIGVCETTIRQWCGTSGNNGKPPKNKIGCYAVMKYGDSKC